MGASLPTQKEPIKYFMGDCQDLLKDLPGDCIDTIITDPPYGLKFMGQKWDYDLPGPSIWAECLRVAKPGAILLCFGGSRTFHRMACIIEDSGWEIRDCLMWLYGEGFPKSYNIAKGIDKAQGKEGKIVGPNPNKAGRRSDSIGQFGGQAGDVRESNQGVYLTKPESPQAQTWDGWGTALKPAYEPIIMAMKPLNQNFVNNALVHGVAGLNIDGARIGTSGGTRSKGKGEASQNCYGDGLNKTGVEPINKGRWPANVIIDQETAQLIDSQSGQSESKRAEMGEGWQNGYVAGQKRNDGFKSTRGFNDKGGASRFFYVAKASRSERNAGMEKLPKNYCATMGDGIGERPHNEGEPGAYVPNFHPTVKPVELIKYLCTLTRTPTGGLVLDPFLGSGTTLRACRETERQGLGFELNPEYEPIIKERALITRPPLEAWGD